MSSGLRWAAVASSSMAGDSKATDEAVTGSVGVCISNGQHRQCVYVVGGKSACDNDNTLKVRVLDADERLLGEEDMEESRVSFRDFNFHDA